MNNKTDPLDQLRIDRTPNSQTVGASTRRAWIFGIGAIVMISAIGVVIFSMRRTTLPVRPVVVQKEARPPLTSSVNGAILDASGYVVALREATVSGKSIYKVE